MHTKTNIFTKKYKSQQKKVTNSSSLFFFSNHSLILSTALTCRMRRPFKSRMASKLVVFLPVGVAPVSWNQPLRYGYMPMGHVPLKQETWDLGTNHPPQKKIWQKHGGGLEGLHKRDVLAQSHAQWDIIDSDSVNIWVLLFAQSVASCSRLFLKFLSLIFFW